MGVFDDMLKLAAQEGIYRKRAKEGIENEVELQRRLAELQRQQYEQSPVLGYLGGEGFQFGPEPPAAEQQLPLGVQGPPAMVPDQSYVPLRLADVEKSPVLADVLRRSLFPKPVQMPEMKYPSGHRLVPADFFEKHPEAKGWAIKIDSGPFAGQYMVPSELFDKYTKTGGGSSGKEPIPVPLDALAAAGYDTSGQLPFPVQGGYALVPTSVANKLIKAEPPVVQAPGDVLKTKADFVAMFAGPDSGIVEYGTGGNQVINYEKVPGSPQFWAAADSLNQASQSPPAAIEVAARMHPDEGAAVLRALYGVRDKDLKIDKHTGELNVDKKPASANEAVGWLVSEKGMPGNLAKTLVDIILKPDGGASVELKPEYRRALDGVQIPFQ